MREFFTSSPDETRALAEKFALELKGGEVVAFKGGLGMGKTTFVSGAASALGVGDLVSSPTFAIVNDYGGKPHIYHFDMYRVEDWDSLYTTGFFDYMTDENVLFIEWSENIESALPENTIYITMEKTDSDFGRKITFDGGGY